MKKHLKISKNSSIRQMWFVLGVTATGLGIAGYILPVMPGTTFILLAAYCFARSNEKWYFWLLNNKHFGQTIRDFQDGKGMSLKAKITAISMIVVSIGISMYFASNIYVIWFLIICGIIAVSCVLYQKTKNKS
jgi:uncharacterized membrane protein YbaN (DUF454 family)